MVALGYSCSSTARRLDNADLRAQTDAVKRYCLHQGWELADVVHEVEPRRRYGRPALRYAIDRLEDGDVSCLVVSRAQRDRRPDRSRRGEVARVQRAGRTRLQAAGAALLT